MLLTLFSSVLRPSYLGYLGYVATYVASVETLTHLQSVVSTSLILCQIVLCVLLTKRWIRDRSEWPVLVWVATETLQTCLVMFRPHQTVCMPCELSFAKWVWAPVSLVNVLAAVAVTIWIVHRQTDRLDSLTKFLIRLGCAMLAMSLTIHTMFLSGDWLDLYRHLRQYAWAGLTISLLSTLLMLTVRFRLLPVSYLYPVSMWMLLHTVAASLAYPTAERAVEVQTTYRELAMVLCAVWIVFLRARVSAGQIILSSWGMLVTAINSMLGRGGEGRQSGRDDGGQDRGDGNRGGSGISQLVF